MKKFIKNVTKSFHTGEKGFTLIELLIVIVILGVLAAAIIPNLSRFIGTGNVGAANAELASVKTAISAYQSDHNGVLPIDASNVVQNDSIDVTAGANGYIQGEIKGLYKTDAYGVITQAANGTWPTTIVFANVAGSGLMWTKGTGGAAAYAP